MSVLEFLCYVLHRVPDTLQTCHLGGCDCRTSGNWGRGQKVKSGSFCLVLLVLIPTLPAWIPLDSHAGNSLNWKLDPLSPLPCLHWEAGSPESPTLSTLGADF